ncbi:MAG: hypothetical protein M5R36_14010 [Deltaproteobacteria bacterium]|nr:hypothetical protein [Deltaproteobacteria bacterium]
MPKTANRVAIAGLRIVPPLIVSGLLAAVVALPVLASQDLIPVNLLYGLFPYTDQRYEIFLATLALPYVGTIVAFFWLWWIAAAIWRAALAALKCPPFEAGQWRAVAGVALKVVLVAATIPLFAGFVWAEYQNRSGNAGVFRKACTQCHSLRRPLSHIRSRTGWKHTVARMAGKDASLITDREAELIVEHLTAIRGLTSEALWSVKCLTCHSEAEIAKPRPREEWEGLIKRIHRFNPFHITVAQVDELLDHVEASDLVAPAAPSDQNTAFRRMYETRCGRCHTLDIILDPALKNPNWVSILDRMDRKAPWLSEHGPPSRDLADWIEAMRREPEEFRRHFPHHDRRLFVGVADASP